MSPAAPPEPGPLGPRNNFAILDATGIFTSIRSSCHRRCTPTSILLPFNRHLKVNVDLALHIGPGRRRRISPLLADPPRRNCRTAPQTAAAASLFVALTNNWLSISSKPGPPCAPSLPWPRSLLPPGGCGLSAAASVELPFFRVVQHVERGLNFLNFAWRFYRQDASRDDTFEPDLIRLWISAFWPTPST